MSKPSRPPLDPVAEAALRKARLNLPDRLILRNRLAVSRHEVERFERTIARMGKHQRQRGKLNAAQKTKLASTRSDLDALNDAIFQNRKTLLT
jgi:hypothetical protein